MVATNDVHYSRDTDAEAQDFLSCIGNGRRIDDPDRRTLSDGNYALRSAEEMYELFAYAPQACENTIKIAEMIDIDIPHGLPLLPTYQLNPDEVIISDRYHQLYPEDRDTLTPQEWLLRHTCFQGLNHRYGFTLTEEAIFHCVHKEIRESVPELKDVSPEDLMELPK